VVQEAGLSGERVHAAFAYGGMVCSFGVEGYLLQHGRAEYQCFLDRLQRGVGEGKADPDCLCMHAIVDVGVRVGLEEFVLYDFFEGAVAIIDKDSAVLQQGERALSTDIDSLRLHEAHKREEQHNQSFYVFPCCSFHSAFYQIFVEKGILAHF